MSRDETIRQLQRELQRNGEDVVVVDKSSLTWVLEMAEREKSRTEAGIRFIQQRHPNPDSIARHQARRDIWENITEWLAYAIDPETERPLVAPNPLQTLPIPTL